MNSDHRIKPTEKSQRLRQPLTLEAEDKSVVQHRAHRHTQYVTKGLRNELKLCLPDGMALNGDKQDCNSRHGLYKNRRHTMTVWHIMTDLGVKSCNAVCSFNEFIS